MLISLSIQNFAIIEQVKIDFSSGMTVLSGETGAGKSIIIDALGVLCGGRGSSDYIRHGSDKLIVEGLFQVVATEEIQRILDDFGLNWSDSEDELILRREINSQGKNIIRVNGQLANVSLLKDIGAYLIDIHGQNEHQSLLDKTQHMSLLDEFGAQVYQNLVADYQNAFQTYESLRRTFFNAHKNESDNVQRLNFLEFQLKEIEQYQLVAEEDVDLEEKSRKLQNNQIINQTIEKINYLFSESDTSLLTQLNQITDLIDQIQSYDSQFPVYRDQLTSIQFDLEDIAQNLAVKLYDVVNDDQSLDEVEERLTQLSQIKRKYNMTIPELLAYYDELSEEIYQIQHREQYINRLEKELTAAYQNAYNLALALHQAREEVSEDLVTAIQNELAELYMENSRFKVAFKGVELDTTLNQLDNKEWVKLTENGIDEIEFFVKTNVGEEFKPLVKVASGGELSRYMLALKTVFSTHSKAKTMIFDEIDTGVSGRVAQAIAEKIYLITKNHQVLCITHLPQVAAIADVQLYIRKMIEEGRTFTQVAELNQEERSEVIAQMMSGKVITPASLKLAKELLMEFQH